MQNNMQYATDNDSDNIQNLNKKQKNMQYATDNDSNDIKSVKKQQRKESREDMLAYGVITACLSLLFFIVCISLAFTGFPHLVSSFIGTAAATGIMSLGCFARMCYLDRQEKNEEKQEKLQQNIDNGKGLDQNKIQEGRNEKQEQLQQNINNEKDLDQIQFKIYDRNKQEFVDVTHNKQYVNQEPIQMSKYNPKKDYSNKNNKAFDTTNNLNNNKQKHTKQNSGTLRIAKQQSSKAESKSR